MLKKRGRDAVVPVRKSGQNEWIAKGVEYRRHDGYQGREGIAGSMQPRLILMVSGDLGSFGIDLRLKPRGKPNPPLAHRIQFYLSNTMARLSPQRARTGNQEALDQISRRLTKENYTLAVLDAALVNLDLKDYPNHPARNETFVNRIISAFNVIHLCISRCRRTPELRTATSSLLEDHYDRLLAGMSLVIREIATHYAHLSVGNMLVDMTLLDDDLCSLVYSSRRTVSFILKLWRYKPSIEDEASGYLKEIWIPPASSLVTNCLLHRDGEPLLCDLLLSSKRQLSSFMDMLLFKLKRLGDLQYLAPRGGVLHQHSQSLNIIFARFEKRVGSMREKKSLCLKALAGTTAILLPALKNNTRLLDHSAVLFRVARSIQNLVPILESGLVQALVNAFPTCDWKGENEIENGTFIIAFLASGACYPRVLIPLSQVTAPLLEQLESRTTQNPWYSLASYVEENFPVHSTPYGAPPPPLSALNSILQLLSPDGSRPPVKACSGCRLMTYCSASCQREDWKSKHQFECVELRQRFQGYFDANQISQRTKAFHLALATRLANDPSFQASCKLKDESARYFTHHASELIVGHDLTYPKFPKKRFVLYSWDDWFEKGGRIGVCPALEPRLVSFAQEAKCATRAREDMNETISAVELSLDWNFNQYLSLVVRFEDIGGGRLRPKRSILRVVQMLDPEASLI
ncbi:hypothetical protein BKA70DRAFT_1483825 [Coprinopsis sp. MPI-PUGE-AT-0042]|nr:hypothetical protein BKA70DRAFT_1483825 [Coprinopsis sp. MPI-PUGE-AT-0042]